MQHTTIVITTKEETLVTCGPGANHLARAELGACRAGIGAGVRNCIVI